MTEMSQYDPTIIQASTESKTSQYHENSEIDQQDSIKVLTTSSKDVTPEPDQPSPKGVPSAVYYPPGDLYSADPEQSEVISNPSTERKKKDRSDKKSRDDGG